MASPADKLGRVNQIPHWIAGQSVHGGSRSGSVFNPATGIQTGSLQFADAATVEQAIAAAAAAFPAWRDTPMLKRARVMFCFKALLDEHGLNMQTPGR